MGRGSATPPRQSAHLGNCAGRAPWPGGGTGVGRRLGAACLPPRRRPPRCATPCARWLLSAAWRGAGN